MKNPIIILFITFIFACTEESLKTPTSIDNLSVGIISPSTNILETDELIFEGIISSPSGLDISNLAVVWESDIDGVLNTTKVPLSGKLSFTVSELSRNIHRISLTVINEANERKSVSRILNYAIKLDIKESNSNYVTLQWENYFSTSFEYYEILKSRRKSMYEKEIVATVQDSNSKIYTDPYDKLGETYYYQVAGKSADTTVYSTVQEITAGSFLTLDVPIQRFKYDAKRNRVYAISNLYGHERPYYTAVIDLDRFEVIKKIDGIAYDIDIDDDFQYIYLASGPTLNRLDLESFEITDISPPNICIGSDCAERFVYRLELTGDGRIIYQFRDGCIYCTLDGKALGLMETNGNHLFHSDNEFEYGNFIYDRNYNVIYHTDKDYSSYFTFLISITESGFTKTKDLSNVDWESLSTAAVQAGEHFPFIYSYLTNYKPENIIAYSPFEPIVATNNAVYDLQRNVLIQSLPGSFDAAFFIDKETLLLVRRTENNSSGDRFIESKIFIYKL